MANKSASLNELLGNFYPGGPMPKKPNVPSTPNPPVEFRDFDQFYEDYFTQLEKELTKSVRLPFDMLTKDLSIDIGGTLSTEAKTPSDAKYENVPVEFKDDIDDLPSTVAVKLNMNPLDWVKDPKKETTGFIGGLIKNTFGYDIKSNKWDFSDLEKTIENDYIWDPLFKGRHVGEGRLTSSSYIPNFIEELTESRITGKGTSGLGIVEDADPAKKLVDFKKIKDSYLIGEGRVYSPDSPVISVQNTLAQGMGKLKDSGGREKTVNSMYAGLIDVLDKEKHRDGDVSYVLTPEFDKLMKTKIAIDKKNTMSSILDLQENDAITNFSSNLKNNIGEANKILSKSNVLTPDEKENLLSKLNLSSKDRSDILSKSGLNEKDITKLNRISENIDDFAGILIGDKKSPGIVGQITTAIDTGPALGTSTAEQKVKDLSSTLKNITTDRKKFISEVGSGALGTMLTDTRNELKNNVDVSKSSDFVFREQYSYLSKMGNFNDELGKKLTNISKRNFDSKKLPDEVKSIQDLCDSNIKEYKRIDGLLNGNKEAQEEFRKIFSKHNEQLNKIRSGVENVQGTKDAKILLKKFQSAYSTPTISGGIQDAANRRFSEAVYFGNGALAEAFSGANTQNFENAKRTYLLARKRYEDQTARSINKMILEGPKEPIKGLVKSVLKEKIGLRNFDLDNFQNFFVENIVKPTHFFGMNYNEDVAKECAERGGLSGWLEKNIGQRLVAKNSMSMNIGGKAFSMLGGKHLEGAVALGKLLQNSSIDTKSLSSLMNLGGRYLFNIINIQNLSEDKAGELHLEALLNNKRLIGKNLGIGEREGLYKFVLGINAFKKWALLPENAAIAQALEMKVVKGVVTFNELKMAELFKKLALMGVDPSSINPTSMLVGRLQQLSQVLSKWKTNWLSLVSKINRPIVFIKAAISEALTQGIMVALDSVTGLIGEVLRIFVKAVVNKIVDLGEELFRGILKLDLSEFINDVTKTVGALIKWMVYFVLVPLILLFMLFDQTNTITAAVSPVDNSRTNGVLLSDCGEIDAHAEGVGTCGVCGPSGSVDWSPYTLGAASFTDGMGFVLNAAANDFKIPAAALAAIVYSEGWSENVDGKFADPWTKDNVCSWSYDEGPLIPGCTDRVSSSDARGPFQQIPGYFYPLIEQHDVAGKTPLPRGTYDPCNFLDAAYAVAARFSEFAQAGGISGCNSAWLSPVEQIPGYKDSLGNVPFIQHAILHYTCGSGLSGDYCTRPEAVTYSEKGLAVFNSLKCF